MNIDQAIKYLYKQIPPPSQGMPENIFLFISRITPMINVDLLIKDERARTLLSWRDDIYSGSGWHIPGGIIHFKEKLETRIKKVAECEIGTDIKFDPNPIALNQVFRQGKTRGHFISLLYKCFLSDKFTPKNEGLKKTDSGYLMWHNSCPTNLIRYHKMYRSYI